MAGAAPTPSGHGGKKALDAELNLVPFIDLLSCCISFLLITAVWTQIAGLQVASSGGGQQIKVGQRVGHETYGAGTVKLLEGSESDRKVTIESLTSSELDVSAPVKGDPKLGDFVAHLNWKRNGAS